MIERLRQRWFRKSPPARRATEPKDGELKTDMVDLVLSDMLRERKSKRRWRLVRRSLLVAAGVVGFLLYILFYATALGYRMMPGSDVAGVVRIEGEIGNESLASADRVIPVLRSAFEAPNVKAEVLAIDSPGGARWRPNASTVPDGGAGSQDRSGG